jgi:hypothetical protein
MELIWFLIGFTVGLVVPTVFMAVKLGAIKRGKFRVPHVVKNVGIALFVGGLLLIAQALPTFAQTPVPLEIPTNVIFTETNNWMATFAPIAAIGIGITLALAILGYIGKLIKSAFS